MKQAFKDRISRLAIAFLEKFPELEQAHGDEVMEVIDRKLKEYKLRLVCNKDISSSAAQQAALLTAVNVGKRCYKGGVYVEMAKNVPSLLPWPGSPTLNDIVAQLGGRFQETECTLTIRIGASDEKTDWRLLVNNWTAAVVPPGFDCPAMPGSQSFPLGGILGAGLAVGQTFLKTARFDMSIGMEITGLSLWRPDLPWDHEDAMGPVPAVFPQKLWLLGLGHLGQAYAWTIGLMPFLQPREVMIKLQDDDRIVPGNYDSGMLAEEGHEDHYKTRVVAAWLEDRGLHTRIVERKYDKDYRRQGDDDPSLLLAGVDKVAVRKALRTGDFQLLVDCGLGGNLDFDLIHFHAFPNNGTTPEELWKGAVQRDQNLRFKDFSQRKTGCGFTLGIASAFTGCVSACIMISEVLRSCHFGVKLSSLVLSLRELEARRCGQKGHYGNEILLEVTPLDRQQVVQR